MNRYRSFVLPAVLLALWVIAWPSMAWSQNWSLGESIPLAHDYTATAELDGKIYALGGSLDGVRLPDVQIYDPSTGSWSPGTPMSLRRDDFTAEALDGKLYVFGGSAAFKAGEALDSVEVYDPIADRWTSGASMPDRLSGHASAVIDGKIYVVGGQRDGIERDDLWVFDPKGREGSWTVLRSLPTARTELGAAAIGSKLYVAGGAVLGESPIGLSTLEIYDASTDTWSTGPSLRLPRWRAPSVQAEGKLYVLGGRSQDEFLADVEVFDPVAEEWDFLPSMPSSVSVHGYSAVAVGSSIFLVGGEDVATLLELEAAPAPSTSIGPGKLAVSPPLDELFKDTHDLSDRALVEYFGETLGLPTTEVRAGEHAYLFEGDIIVDAGFVKDLRGDFSDAPLKNAVNRGRTWPNGIVPWMIDAANESDRRNLLGKITGAINQWEEKTNLRFVPRTTETSYVRIYKGSGCHSEIGYYANTVTDMSLGNGCHTKQAVHEIGHAIGFYHHQSRADRNTYVTVTTVPNVYSWARHNYNFPRGQVVGDYDWFSIMHYGQYDFAVKCEDTHHCPIYPNCLNGAYCYGPAMVRAPGHPIGGMGNLGQMMPTDIFAANDLYPNPPTLEVTADAISDTYVYEATPTTNYGTSGDLSIRYGETDFGRFSFLKFNVPSPLGLVTSAKLRIRTRGTTTSETAVYKMNGMFWSESGITWENWDQNGAVSFTLVNHDLTLAANTWHEIDVTSAVTASGTLNLGLASGADFDQDFHSRESADKPQLIIERSGASTLTINAAADAWVSENQPESNFGSFSYLRVRYDPTHHGKFAFLKFQVPTFSGTLVSAKLRIHTRFTDIPSAALYRMTGMDFFNETTLNWLNWDQMGAVDFNYLDSTGVLGNSAWHEIDVTNAAPTSGSRLVLGITTDADQSSLNFWSRESSTYTPQLVITYEP